MIYSWRHPESIHRSVMLAVNPPGHFLWDAKTIDAQIGQYAELCAKDDACRARTGDLAATIKAAAADVPGRWGPLAIKPGNVRVASFFGLMESAAHDTPLSAPMTLDSWVSAAKGDPSGLWFQSLLAQLAFPDEQVWGDVGGRGAVDAGDADTTFAPAATRGSIIGNPGSDLTWAGGGLADAWPAQPDEDDYDRVRTSDTETLLIGGSLDFATPPQNATKELLPHLPNGHQVVLPGFGHTNDFWNLQPAAGSRLVNAFLDSGKVDDSLYTGRDVDFTPVTTLTAMAKILLAVMVGFAAARASSRSLWLALRVNKRGGVGRKAGAMLRSLYPVVLGLGGWFLGALFVLTIAPTVPLDNELLAVLSIGTPIGLGIYWAWVRRAAGAEGEDSGPRGRGRGRVRRRVARVPRHRRSRRRVHGDHRFGSRSEPVPPRPRQRARPQGARDGNGGPAPGGHDRRGLTGSGHAFILPLGNMNA